jgi:hypothetical protein
MSTNMQHQIEWRRAKVMELLSNGESNQSEIARILQVDKSIISRDVAYLRQQAKENMRSHIDKLLEEYEKCLFGITSILKEAWNTSKQDCIEVKQKLAALSLAKECYSMKLDLLTNATVIADATKFVERHKNNEVNNNDKAGDSEEQQSLHRQPMEQPPQETKQEQQQQQEPETFSKTF